MFAVKKHTEILKGQPHTTGSSGKLLPADFLAKHTLLPLVWWRFIDDIFMIWPHSSVEL